MPSWPGFFGGSYQTLSPQADVERTVNLILERFESPGAKSRQAFYSTPGFQKWTASSSVADVGGRALCVAGTRLFAVMGGGFYEFDVNGNPTKWGSVAQDGNPAQMIYNGTVGGQLLIASGTNAYCFVLATNTLSQVLAGTVTHIAYTQTYFLAFNKATGRVALSAQNDGTTWPGGIFFQRSNLADPWQAMFVDGNGLVWLPGTETFEVWSLSNTSSTQPFAPLSGLVGRYGIASSYAWAMAGANPYWLSRTPEGAGVVVRATGGGMQPVTNYGVMNAISMYARTTSISDAEMFPYQDQGHTFLIVHFPSANATWAYDIEGQTWAERGKWNALLGRFDLWTPRAHANAYGKHLIVDRSTGQVSTMDATLATEIDGTGIRRIRIAPALYRDDRRLRIDRLLLLCDVGVGLQVDSTAQGYDPAVMLQISRDGGMTWGNEHQAGLGRIGQFRRRVFWNRIAFGENIGLQVSCSEPVPFRIVDALVNPGAGELAQAA